MTENKARFSSFEETAKQNRKDLEKAENNSRVVCCECEDSVQKDSTMKLQSTGEDICIQCIFDYEPRK